jgi:hypothetical protein
MRNSIRRLLVAFLRSIPGRQSSGDHGEQSKQSVDKIDSTDDDRDETESDAIVDDVPADSHSESSHHDANDGGESEPNRSQDENIGINWPPTKHVTSPHEGEGDERIEVSLYHRKGDEYGRQACRQTVPYLNYAFEEAWGTEYAIDITVVEQPVPEDIGSINDWHEYFWHGVDNNTRSKDANCLVVDHSGLQSQGGGRLSIIDEADSFEGWGYDPADDPVLFGHGDNHYGVNVIIHEIGHCLGLSHDGDPVHKYGKRMISPMRTSYDDGSWFLHELHKECRTQTPKLQDEI